jgi:hypothetical protein
MAVAAVAGPFEWTSTSSLDATSFAAATAEGTGYLREVGMYPR